MNRRTMLGLAAGGGLAALAGCTESVHRARGANTPMGLVVDNASGAATTVTVEIERDGASVFNGTVAFDADGTVTDVEGDDFRDVEFTEAGEYAIRAETDERDEETTTAVTWQDLADCNDVFAEVLVFEDQIMVGVSSTDMDCGGIDRLGG